MSVHQLVANAVILDGQEDEADAATAEETP